MIILGITMGCPAGIGPEIILRYFADRSRSPELQPVVLGDRGILEKCAADLSLPGDCRTWLPGQPVPEQGIPVLDLSAIPVHEHRWGCPTPVSDAAMAEYIVTAVRLAKSGDLAGMVTCPISKSGLHRAGYAYPGHTEMLVDLCGAENYTMMMAGDSLKVTLATIHCSLASVPKRLSVAGIRGLIAITHQALCLDFAVKSPRIAVAGLNPHSSEEGLFGHEESEVILPAIQEARSAGIEVEGPFPPDTVFFKASRGEFDAVVCMYHDQGLIPFKLLHFKDGVNVTLGLPIVRTSVDHGTAYDIAGRGVADCSSLAAAVTMAADISANRSRRNQSPQLKTSGS
jgi:4-hydroxythreonine-4-phosphate dehydrogenase